MKPKKILKELKSKIPKGMHLKDALITFIDHYETSSADGCKKNDDCDMLLFQWGGPYDWDPAFSINLTRQFSYQDEDGEYDRMEQLSMDCRFDSVKVSVEPGSQWLEGDDLEKFKELILNSEVVKLCADEKMKAIRWELSEV